MNNLLKVFVVSAVLLQNLSAAEPPQKHVPKSRLIEIEYQIALYKLSSKEELGEFWEIQDRYRYRKFADIDYFAGMYVLLLGSAEEIGLDEKSLCDYARLRFRNNFGDMEFRSDPIEVMQAAIKAATEDSISVEEILAQVGTIRSEVWTVGDEYPIAYHVMCEAANLGGDKIWDSAFLGYCSKSKIADAVKECIDSLIESVAIDFHKTRGKL